MIRFCMALASVAFWPSLPSPWLLFPLLFGLLLLSLLGRRVRRWWLPVWFGLLWGAAFGHWQLAHRLASELERQPLDLVVTVTGLPQAMEDHCRFDVDVDRWPVADRWHPRRLRLNDYKCARLPLPGEQWAMTVRLKRPHGYRNPGGADRELQLLSLGIDATGSVVGESRRLNQHPWRGRWDRWRWQLAEHIRTRAGEAEGALINALLFGDRRHLSQPQWRRLRETGTLHLFVVSGMHIGLVALALYGIVRRLGRFVPHWRLHHRQWGGLLAALTGSACYAALAGWGLPTQRAWVMVAVLMLGWVSWRGRSHSERLWLAAAAVLVLDPLAIRSVGFWLSFAAAAGLLYAFAGWRSRGWWRPLVRAQWAAFLVISPWLVLAFQQLPLLSPLINLVAIPLVTLLLLPLALITVLLLPLEVVGDGLLAGVALLVGLFDTGLGWVHQFGGVWNPGPAHLGAALLALGGSLLLLAPRALPLRWLGLLLWLPLLLPRESTLPDGAFEVTVLDVGQGTAVLVRTRSHRLLFDTGPQYRSGFSVAEVTVLPFLRQAGIARLDRVVVSHADSDHAGGLALLQREVLVGGVLSGDAALTGGDPCIAGQQWRWDGVVFRVLHPADGEVLDRNNRSCLLRVDGPGGSVLLAGDLEGRIEQQLVRRLGDMLRADLLLAPHHGSRTSSSLAWVNAVRPHRVVFSSGYHNRYGHPHPEVIERFAAAGTAVYTTATMGALKWAFGPGGTQIKAPEDEQVPRYWRN